jgi:hypothetical protein
MVFAFKMLTKATHQNYPQKVETGSGFKDVGKRQDLGGERVIEFRVQDVRFRI